MVKIMNIKQFSLMVLMLIVGANISFVFSQNKNEEVTLVVSGDGATKEEATKSALRSAIEQAFGTFVSSNTQILNDELVRDEIVTVSAGNIKKYEYLSEIEHSGKYYVTINATVSIGKLVSYAKSKGSKAEFAGETFAMNVKLMELREQNTFAAYKNMCLQVEELADEAFNYKIELEEPVIAQSKVSSLYKTRKGILSYHLDGTTLDGYVVSAKISVLATQTTSQIYNLIHNTLNSLKLTAVEMGAYVKIGKKLYNYTTSRILNRDLLKEKDNDIILPISEQEIINQIRNYDSKVCSKLINAFTNYKIVDLSNSENVLSWKPNLKITDKIVRIKIPSIDSRFFCPLYSAENSSVDEKYDINRYLWLVNTKGESAVAMGWLETGGIGFIHFDGGYARFITRLERPGVGWFVGRVDHNTNWEKWLLPEMQGTNKKKKNKQSINTNSNQAICEYSIPIFIQKDKIKEFKGLSIEKNNTPL